MTLGTCSVPQSAYGSEQQHFGTAHVPGLGGSASTASGILRESKYKVCSALRSPAFPRNWDRGADLACAAREEGQAEAALAVSCTD